MGRTHASFRHTSAHRPAGAHCKSCKRSALLSENYARTSVGTVAYVAADGGRRCTRSFCGRQARMRRASSIAHRRISSPAGSCPMARIIFEGEGGLRSSTLAWDGCSGGTSCKHRTACTLVAPDGQQCFGGGFSRNGGPDSGDGPGLVTNAAYHMKAKRRIVGLIAARCVVARWFRRGIATSTAHEALRGHADGSTAHQKKSMDSRSST